MSKIAQQMFIFFEDPKEPVREETEKIFFHLSKNMNPKTLLH